MSEAYQTYIAMSRYARWLPEESRRETWEETVKRYFDFFEEHLKETCGYDVPVKIRKECENAVLNLEVMPSMRALMTAGPALKRCNMAGFNCAFVAVDSPRAFDEALYILMCGTGVGFSVERDFINQLPEVADTFIDTTTTIVVEDSKEGWAKAFRELAGSLWAGLVPRWDLSRVRPAGARLKTFGGRASGPGPLEDLFRFAIRTFKQAAGRKLSSIECHDLMCKIGEIVVVGGVRRSALISLSNFSDGEMRAAKSGDFPSYRQLANNSVAYTRSPTIGGFMQEWLALYESRRGERGIFHRPAAQAQASRSGRRDGEQVVGTNPCGEILLRSMQCCNLSEAVVREGDTKANLKRKVRIAAILGTWQSTLTRYRYVRSGWRKNNEEERLLGVSLTGIYDNELTYRPDPGMLHDLRSVVIRTNAKLAEELGIPQSTATTCVKPSGTVSQRVDCASGIHPRFALYYIRRVKGDRKDPMTVFMIDAGVDHEPDAYNPETVVFEFPMAAPEGALVRGDYHAIGHLRLWMDYKNHWCEHNPSITVNLKEDEWLEVAAWVYDFIDEMTGVTFLPEDGGDYQQPPYEEIDKEEYERRAALMPEVIDWTRLSEYETEDHTTGAQELACSGDVCEVVDIGAAA